MRARVRLVAKQHDALHGATAYDIDSDSTCITVFEYLQRLLLMPL